MAKIAGEYVRAIITRAKASAVFFAFCSIRATLELFFKFLLHLLVVSRDDRIKFIAVIDMPFGLIVILVVHDSELGFILLLAACLSGWLKSLQVNSLEPLNLYLVDLREMTHLTAATAMRLSLPTFSLA